MPVVIQSDRVSGELPRKAALFARRHGVRPRLVSASGLDLGVFDPSAPLAGEGAGTKPMRVSLLGLGELGLGVLDELLGAPKRYRVVGIALTSEDARHAPTLTPEIASFDVDEILTRPCDVVINLAPGNDTVTRAVEQARLRGVNVVQGVASLSRETQRFDSPTGYRFVAPASSADRGWRLGGARRVSHRSG